MPGTWENTLKRTLFQKFSRLMRCSGNGGRKSCGEKKKLLLQKLNNEHYKKSNRQLESAFDNQTLEDIRQYVHKNQRDN